MNNKVNTEGYIKDGFDDKPIVQMIDEFEEKINSKPELAESLDEAIVADLDDLLKKYSFRLKGHKIYTVDEDGKAINLVAKYNILKNQLEVTNAALTDPKVAELGAQFAKSNKWKTVTVVPPSNAQAQKFMEVTLTALLQPDMYDSDEVNVPKEFEALKAQIYSKLRNNSALKEGNLPEEPVNAVSNGVMKKGKDKEHVLTDEQSNALLDFEKETDLTDSLDVSELNESVVEHNVNEQSHDDWEEVDFTKPDNESVDYDMSELRGASIKKSDKNITNNNKLKL